MFHLLAAPNLDGNSSDDLLASNEEEELEEFAAPELEDLLEEDAQAGVEIEDDNFD